LPFLPSLASFLPFPQGDAGVASQASLIAPSPIPTLERRLYNLDAVMVSQEEVEEKNLSLSEMRRKTEQMKSDMDYSLHRKDTEWGEQLKIQKDEFEVMLTAERTKYEELQLRHEQHVREHMDEVDTREADHAQVTQELENQYEHKLAMEMERFDKLSEEMELMRQRCEGLLEAQESKHQKQLLQERTEYEKIIKERTEKLKQLVEDLKYNEVKFEEILSQQEKEYEDELRTMRAKMGKEIAAERKERVKKQSELTSKDNKFDALTNKMGDMKEKEIKLETKFQEEIEKKEGLQKIVAHLESNMKEHQITLAEKERSILALRSNNKTLDNFRFVLDHRLQQFMEEKGPVQDHIETLEGHIRHMYEELVGFFDQQKRDDATSKNKDLKIDVVTREVKMLRNEIRDKDRVISAFNRELSNIVNLTTPKDIEDAVKDAYRFFVKGEKPKNNQRSQKV
jgi:chromosome segregation ATPase